MGSPLARVLANIFKGFTNLSGLKADSRLGWPDIFKSFRVIFSLKKKTIQFLLSFNLFFQQKSPRVGSLPLTNETLFEFLTSQTGKSYHVVVMYLFNSLAKTCTLF